MATKAEIAISEETPKTDLLPGIPANADLTNLSYADLVNSGEMYRIPGFGLVTDKDELIGVPHIIVGVTFQKPITRKNAPFGEQDYVTLRAMVGDEEALNEATTRGWIPGKLAFKPGELICYNDGSTGVRRDVVKILQNFGLIDVGDIPEGIDLNSPFDKPWSQWNSFSQFTDQGGTVVPEFSTNHRGNLFQLGVYRGLRKSEYSNDYTEDGVTYYL